MHSWTDELRESPEFQFLHDWLGVELAAATDGSVERADMIPASPAVPVLVTGARTLLLRRSLRALEVAVDHGAAAAVPRRLAATALPLQLPIYTVRGIETAETRFLEMTPPAEVPSTGTVPAVLLAPSAATELVALGNATAGAALDAAAFRTIVPGSTEAGLCHEFIDYYGEAREDIVPFVPSDCRELLEVGCGRGSTGRILQDRCGCRVTGVELNPVVAMEASRHLHHVICGDVEHVQLDTPFDAVVACELFEHLTDPLRFLRRMRDLVRPGGRIILSVPNVGHWSVVDDLMAGRWDYLPVGLLCHTHFRFYTRQTLETWLRSAGFERFEISAQRTDDVPPRFQQAPAGFEPDIDSLSTSGFYVVIEE